MRCNWQIPWLEKGTYLIWNLCFEAKHVGPLHGFNASSWKRKIGARLEDVLVRFDWYNKAHRKSLTVYSMHRYLCRPSRTNYQNGSCSLPSISVA